MSALGEKLDLPPILPTFKDEVEFYLTNSEFLPINQPENSRKFWPVAPQPLRLFSTTISPAFTSIEVARDLTTGEIIGINEVFNEEVGSTAKNSFSLRRLPGPPENMVRGMSTNLPFWPGGIPEVSFNCKENVDINLLFDTEKYLTKHPKLSRGLDFSSKSHEKINKNHMKKNDVINLADLLNVDNTEFDIFNIKSNKDNEKMNIDISNTTKSATDTLNSTLKIEKKTEEKIIKISESSIKENKGTEWAILVNINSPVDDFKERIPFPACMYDFELDTFQKQAILHVENRDNVFVAAHTSAGKTVVAEYCIALALKHMTKAIYTSPIKALSNQKYRDLKIKFGDVGLLTGDTQLNCEASCLIMTTEILQSMLYNGSDVIRDLEWVIFDEVHYINNIDRGHVWEEVIIMLPEQVRIVLLSATVPNTVEFADWIGRIKKRKIYVISTNKRPVPLEHFLYTGTDGKSKHERFMIVNSNEKFVLEGYNKAVDAKQERKKSYTKPQGSKGASMNAMSEKQEMNMWIGLMDHLSTNDLLPVVAFTLSKKRCNQNATHLLSQDFTTKEEKGKIHIFIKKCIDKLQGTDKQIRQVLQMQEMLKKGIGIHHSGILPILKEVVEMLFAKGLVKLLFATETFAMGVNMPARSVVFDSLRKHDGTTSRFLLPSEYIQMAGRAGRRGLDTTGTVIILCKVNVLEANDLRNIMLGKPTKLESQFKLTYSMILNLLKAEHLRVEDMMKRSFSESLGLKNQPNYSIELREKESHLEALEPHNCILCEDLEQCFKQAKQVISLEKDFLSFFWTHFQSKKILSVGKIILFSEGNFHNYVGCVIKLDGEYCTLLVLINKEFNFSNDNNNDKINAILTCIKSKITITENALTEKLVETKISNIVGFSDKKIKVDSERIIKNIKEREMPRFKNNPPGKSVVEAITELNRVISSEVESFKFITDTKMSTFNIKALKIVEKFRNISTIKSKLKESKCINCPQFEDHFSKAFDNLEIKSRIDDLKYLMSENSLQLHPEYEMRIDVLRKLGYIEENNMVTLKGRVACEMGNNELIVAELLLENVLDDKPVEEIAAILSSLVFQQKNCSDPNLNKELKEGKRMFQSVAEKIGKTQQECGLKETVGDYVDQYNFGLCEVVHKWALGTDFNKIIELTDVQEGIIVKCIQRLVETLRDVRKAAIIIGVQKLKEKMEEAATAIKRDIVFADSLYTQ